jgi:CO/xanthine dehydrogenase Mo-binding subunit
LAATRTANLLALENKMIWDGGASTEYGVNITRAGGYSSSGPYDFPNVKTDSYCVYTNNVVGGPYRGFGMSELHTGIEQCIDELAEKMGMDKVEAYVMGKEDGIPKTPEWASPKCGVKAASKW